MTFLAGEVFLRVAVNQDAMDDQKTFKALVLLGAVPFAVAGGALLIGVTSLPLVGDTRTALALYGLTIVCFLTGIHWATQLYKPEATPFNLFVISNVVFLAALGAYLAASIRMAMLTLIAALVAALLIDLRLRAAGVLSASYLRMRIVATVIACPALTVAAIIA